MPQQDTPVTSNVTPVTTPADATPVTSNVTPAPVVSTDTATVTPAPISTEPTVMDATKIVPGPDAVKVELPEVPVTSAATTPVTTVPPTV